MANLTFSNSNEMPNSNGNSNNQKSSNSIFDVPENSAPGGFLGSGWSFPPTFESANKGLNMTNGDTNIGQSIDLILQTPLGSRSLSVDYGSLLHEFVFRKIDATLQEEMEKSIYNTLLQNEPRIEVNNINVEVVDYAGGSLAIEIDYSVIESNSRHNHVYPFSVLEGTNLQEFKV
ncbi:MAG: hypothetical protein COA42_06395 [Alteromonadaceae bacterium]|nr:MAG: hypothetical protein COA42_06395 [Alteromonadaceae bacterium]